MTRITASLVSIRVIRGDPSPMDFIAAAAQFGFSLTPHQHTQFQQYLALLQIWNARLNLTAIREPAEIWRRHFLDSLSCYLVTGSLDGVQLIDVGTGAGFPGLPLKIAYPDLQLTLVESVRKKTQFLQAVVTELGLTNVIILPERAETLGQQSDHRERYDLAVARAVADLPLLLEYLLPLCRVGGLAVAQKGEGAAAELARATHALQKLGGELQQLKEVWLPEGTRPHYLIAIHKIQPTPATYPRRPGQPARRPL